MTPDQTRQAILLLCESYAAAAVTGNQLVIESVGKTVKEKVLEMFPDEAAD